MAEHTIQNEIVRYLAGRKQVRVFRRNVGKFRVLNKDGSKRWIAFGERGQADLWGLFLREDGSHVHFEIEVKTSKGRQTEDQKNWQAACESFGVPYILARSVVDVAMGFGKHGIILEERK